MISTAFAAAAEHGHEAAAFYADPHFWVNVAFFMVIGFAWRPVARGIAAALDARAAKIKARIDEAHRLREEAQDMLATWTRRQRKAAEEAEAIIARAKTDAERMTEQAMRDLEESMARRERLAMERIKAAEAQAVKDVQNLAVDMALAATRTVLAQAISPEQGARLIDDAIAELPQKFH